MTSRVHCTPRSAHYNYRDDHSWVSIHWTPSDSKCVNCWTHSSCGLILVCTRKLIIIFFFILFNKPAKKSPPSLPLGCLSPVLHMKKKLDYYTWEGSRHADKHGNHQQITSDYGIKLALKLIPCLFLLAIIHIKKTTRFPNLSSLNPHHCSKPRLLIWTCD